MRRERLWRIWGAPVALGAISLLGLTAALVADGAGDALSWAALAVPVVVCGWYPLAGKDEARRVARAPRGGRR